MYCVGAMKVLVPVRGLVLSQLVQRAEAALAVAVAIAAALSIVSASPMAHRWARCEWQSGGR